MINMVKDKKNKKTTGAGKKCKTCSLDCVVTRAIATESARNEATRDEVIKAMFGEKKPSYTSETCPKK